MTTPGIQRLARDAAVEVGSPPTVGDQPAFQRRQAYITAIASDWLSCSIKFPESTDPIPARFMHPSLAPRVGDTVWVDQNGPDTVVSSAVGVPMGVIEDMDGRVPIPAGWLICDGRSTAGYPLAAYMATTPDLRDRFLVGSGGAYAVGATGGAATHVLSESEMPSHNHQGFHHSHLGPSHSHGQVVTAEVGGGSGSRSDYDSDFAGAAAFPQGVRTDTDGGGATSLDGNAYVTGSRGGGVAQENRPPYYAVVRVIKAF